MMINIWNKNPWSIKGQSSVEMAVVIMVISTSVSAFLGALYLLYASYWIEHIMYEALICQEERGSTQYCISQAQSKIHSTLFLERSWTVRMTRSEFESHIKVQMHFDPLFFAPMNLTFSKMLRI